MFKSFLNIINLLGKKRQRRFYLIIFFAIIGSFFEVFTVYSVGPFISLLTDPNIIYDHKILSWIFNLLKLEYKYFVTSFGIFLFFLVLVSNAFLILISWQSHKFGQFSGSYFSQLLFNNYLSRDYLSHKNSNNNYFIKNIIFEARRCSDGMIGPFTTLISKSVILFSICISLFFINFFITIGIFSFLIFGYVLLFFLIKKKLNKINKDLSLYEKNRYESADNSLKGIKEIKITSTEKFFKDIFRSSSDNYAYTQSLAQILAQFPRFIFETIAVFLVVTFSISSLFILRDQNFASTLPILAMYAFAGFKIMPSLQLVYFSFATIKSNQNSLDIIFEDLKLEITDINKIEKYKPKENINIGKKLELKNISFNYDEKKILSKLNFRINKNEIIGIYGPSGSGKSTLIDIMTGLIKPNSGDFLIDDKKNVIFENSEWFKNISYLSQNIFIFDGTLKDNIVFDLSKKDYDSDKILSVIKLCNLDKISNNGNNLNLDLGYSAQKISGGEKQRIGIARALYRDTQVLIFDEPTSSLDRENEKIFRETVLKIRENRFIIIVSHNKETLSVCDKIYKLKNENLILENDSNF